MDLTAAITGLMAGGANGYAYGKEINRRKDAKSDLEKRWQLHLSNMNNGAQPNLGDGGNEYSGFYDSEGALPPPMSSPTNYADPAAAPQYSPISTARANNSAFFRGNQNSLRLRQSANLRRQLNPEEGEY